jgi:hypothetical protein
MMLSDIAWNRACCKVFGFSKRKSSVHENESIRNSPSAREDFAPVNSRQNKLLARIALVGLYNKTKEGPYQQPIARGCNHVKLGE